MVARAADRAACLHKEDRLSFARVSGAGKNNSRNLLLLQIIRGLLAELSLCMHRAQIRDLKTDPRLSRGVSLNDLIKCRCLQFRFDLRGAPAIDLGGQARALTVQSQTPLE
jgi:hypothetical protein